ncbi:MAG TPA: sigma-70 family RNA polymerase sigma factor [Acidobacteriaceae bacterium]|nr:sigma-70 family RNA polymerase sigma factor [Acidobacteriaceae bacterium]
MAGQDLVMTGPGAPMHERAEQDRRIAEAVQRDEPRLRAFIRRRVRDLEDVEDVLQEVFSELTEAYRMMRPAEEMTAWLYRVARNRITDLFRRKKTVSLNEEVAEQDGRTLEDLLPSPEAGPDAVYARHVLLEELDDAIAELPENQRTVFVAHEILGRSFKEIAEETGVSINTLLARKRYAVLHLRKRLKELQESFED